MRLVLSLCLAAVVAACSPAPSPVTAPPASSSAASPVTSPAPVTAPPASSASPVAAPAGLGHAVGTWDGINGTAGEIVIAADGGYTFNGTPGGSVERSGDELRFSGDLGAWDGGRAKLSESDTVLEFYWSGNWMVFEKA